MDARDFYDEIADDYRLVYPDWAASVRRQAGALDGVIQAELGAGRQRILDCTCGIGTQALGLAALGHEVVGRDVSARAIGRAREEAERLGVDIRLEVADIRSPPEVDRGAFDVVLSADNSLPHLLSDVDLRAGIRGMLSALRRGGLLLASIRDYDGLLGQRPGSTPPMAAGPPGERRIVFQLWEWSDDGRTYELELFVLKERGGDWSVRSAKTRYRPVTRRELTGILDDEGCPGARWIMPEESGFFQPVLMARPGEKPGPKVVAELDLGPDGP